jgi:hypothetical protein
MSMAHG